MQKIIISATNIRGLGAKHLVSFLLNEKCLENYNVLVLENKLNTPLNIKLKSLELNSLKLPYNLFRIFELFFLKYFCKFETNSKLIVLGDIPYNRIRNQNLLFHNPHLIKSFSKLLIEKRFSTMVNKLIFRLNARYLNKVTVQTNHMAKSLIAAFPYIADKVKVTHFPVKLNNSSHTLRPKTYPNKVKTEFVFFYPARNYDHKNHSLITNISDKFLKSEKIKLQLTIAPKKQPENSQIEYLGELSQQSVSSKYMTADALLFTSKEETFGMPLIEAMHHGLLIICPNLPYAREICGNKAFYFDSNSTSSLQTALRSAKFACEKGLILDYSENLMKYGRSICDVLADIIDD